MVGTAGNLTLCLKFRWRLAAMARRNTMGSPRQTLAVATAILAACGQGTDEDSTPSFFQEQPSVIETVLPEKPMIEVGALGGIAGVRFSVIRTARWLPDGGFLVANFSGPPEITAFNETGAVRWVRGRAGEGPGEFAALADVFISDDETVIAYDFWTSRLTYFDLSGALLRTVAMTEFPHPAGSLAVALVGLLRDGTFLARPNSSSPTAGSRALEAAIRVREDASVIDTITEFHGADRSPEGQEGMLLFGRRAVVLPADDRIYLGTGDGFVFDVLDLDGNSLGSFGRPYEARIVTPEMLDALKEEQLKQVRGGQAVAWRRQIEERFRDPVYRDTLPPYEGMLVSRSGDLWVQGYAAPSDTIITWSVFEDGREFTQVVTVPAAFRITDVTDGMVLGVWTDPLDVESVRVYRMESGV